MGAGRFGSRFAGPPFAMLLNGRLWESIALLFARISCWLNMDQRDEAILAFFHLARRALLMIKYTRQAKSWKNEKSPHIALEAWDVEAQAGTAHRLRELPGPSGFRHHMGFQGCHGLLYVRTDRADWPVGFRWKYISEE